MNDFCPYCGSALVEWARESLVNGFMMWQLWRGCPRYRDRAPAYMNHYAVWRAGERRFAYDPITGKPV